MANTRGATNKPYNTCKSRTELVLYTRFPIRGISLSACYRSRKSELRYRLLRLRRIVFLQITNSLRSEHWLTAELWQHSCYEIQMPFDVRPYLSCWNCAKCPSQELFVWAYLACGGSWPWDRREESPSKNLCQDEISRRWAEYFSAIRNGFAFFDFFSELKLVTL